MDKSSYFIKNKALFGSYPSQDDVFELEEQGVKYFVDLTEIGEKKVVSYKTNQSYLHFPIKDNRPPSNWMDFSKLVIQLSSLITTLKEGEMLFLHCKAGVSRSGMLVASLLCYMSRVSPEEAIDLTTRYYGERKLKNKNLYNIVLPKSLSQQAFIRRFFKPLYYYRAYKNGSTCGFSNFSLHEVNVPELGIFPTAEAAFQAFKDTEDTEYIKKLQILRNPRTARKLGKELAKEFELERNDEWERKKDAIMSRVLTLKFEQNDDIRETLLKSCLRPLVDNNRNDEYWGIGEDQKGQNKNGIILEAIRLRYFLT